MTLKEQVAGDVADLFFMLSDFGETHEIEGEEIDIVVDNDELLKLKTGTEIGLSEADILIYARSAELPKRKAPGSHINYDGRECLVVDWIENTGVACILLKQNRTI
ncbi:MAG: sugar ABC transporter ATP-binding protein [Lachnospiraceae bacterium]|nr:sugar ABC transporter ATP-binding protein [Lachnospiraceae bacterium]